MRTDPATLITACAGGNPEAAAFLRSFYDFCHLIDDLRDKPAEVPHETMVGTLVTFIANVSSNPFYQANKGRFEGLMEAGASAWVDSDTITSDDTGSRLMRGFLKGMYHEVFWQAARITGGWSRMRQTVKLCREYDCEALEPAPAGPDQNGRVNVPTTENGLL